MKTKIMLIVLCVFFIIICISLGMFFIVKAKNKKVNLVYMVNPNVPSDIVFDKKQEGVETIEYKGNYYVFIKMGSKSTGGYDIKVEEIKTYDNSNATIYVRTSEPKSFDTVTDAFTYPYVVIWFNEKPNIKVIYNK